MLVSHDLSVDAFVLAKTLPIYRLTNVFHGQSWYINLGFSNYLNNADKYTDSSMNVLLIRV